MQQSRPPRVKMHLAHKYHQLGVEGCASENVLLHIASDELIAVLSHCASDFSGLRSACIHKVTSSSPRCSSRGQICKTAQGMVYKLTNMKLIHAKASEYDMERVRMSAFVAYRRCIHLGLKKECVYYGRRVAGRGLDGGLVVGNTNGSRWCGWWMMVVFEVCGTGSFLYNCTMISLDVIEFIGPATLHRIRWQKNTANHGSNASRKDKLLFMSLLQRSP